jgi:uncharacterized protein YbaR (Trm112 family)
MKRFRFSFRVDSVPPPEFTHDYSDAKRNHFLNDFRPRAQRYRRRNLIATSLLVAAFLGIIVFSEAPIGNRVGIWGLVLVVTCVLISWFISAFGLRLVCPACRKRLKPAKGLYCPECGSDQFRYGSHKRGPSMSRYVYCPSCDSTIDEGGNEDPRSYRIRGCTHCGVMLDEKGL